MKIEEIACGIGVNGNIYFAAESLNIRGKVSGTKNETREFIVGIVGFEIGRGPAGIG